MSLSRNNHYVPQMYLKEWHSKDKNKIYVYKLLVSDKNVPVWCEQSISRTASQDNLYTRVKSGVEYDDIEKMFDQKFETVAREALEKARNGQPLVLGDWNRLIDLMLLQALRTPAFYHYSRLTLETITYNSLQECMNELSQLKEAPEYTCEESDNELIPLSLEREKIPTADGKMVFKATTVVGKSIWQYAIKSIMSESSTVYQRFHSMHWSIAETPEDVLLPTSDNPVLFISANSKGSYKLETLMKSERGIADKNMIIIYPISPRKVLIARSEGQYSSRFLLSREKAMLIKEFVVKNAFLQIYHSEPEEEIENFRERIVNLEQFNRIQEEYKNWYQEYLELEVPYLSKTVI